MNKSEQIDLGLAVAECVQRPGSRMTYKQIAAFCDCSWQYIRHLEIKALRRARLRSINLRKEHF